MEKTDQTLLNSEMLEIEKIQLEKKIHDTKANELKKDIVIKEQQKQINSLKNELLNKAIADHKQAIVDENKKAKALQEQLKNYNKKLAEKYELEGAWGYNPETGSIITED